MENTDVPNASWQGHTATESEWWCAEATVIAEPLLYLVAVLAFLAGSALLVWKTRTPGRFLILSGVLVLAAPLPLVWPSSSNILSPSIASFAVAKLAIALAALLCALGYGRMVLYLYKNSRAAKQS